MLSLAEAASLTGLNKTTARSKAAALPARKIRWCGKSAKPNCCGFMEDVRSHPDRWREAATRSLRLLPRRPIQRDGWSGGGWPGEQP